MDDAEERKRLEQEVIDLICVEGMVQKTEILPTATLASLNLSSIDVVMILTAIEEKFGVYIPMDATVQEPTNLGELLAMLVDLIVRQKQANATSRA